MSNRKSEAAQPAVHNVGAEQALLGCLLRRDVAFFDIHNSIESADFFDPRHRTIFDTITKIASSARGRFDVATVSDFLRGDKETAGIPRDYLEALVDAVADPSALRTYVATVFDLSRTRRMIMALREGERKLMERDPTVPLNEVADEINGEVLDASRSDSSSQKTLAEFAELSYARIDNIRIGVAKSLNLKWGLSAIDNACGPAIPGHLHVIGGRSEMGKTALALGIALSFGEQGPGGIFELEMKGEALADRSLSRLTEIPAWRITRNEARTMDDMESFAEAIAELHKLPIRVEAKAGLTIEQIRAKAIGMKRRYGCRWFMLDHLQIISSSARRADPSETIDTACREMASLAKELDAVWVVLSQVSSKNRDRDNDRPNPRDLMWFNSIEPHADLIMFPYRPEVALRERRPPEPTPGDTKSENAMLTWKTHLDAARDKAELVVGKNRHGPSGVFEAFEWDGPTMRFKPLSFVRETQQYRSEL